jgi:adenosylmethionine-8-amino-7-oxononanoate aminotransferase/4-aminobutyrate--pyruvate transaminase
MADDSIALIESADERGTAPVARRGDDHLWYPWSPVGRQEDRIRFERGDGCWVRDDTGKSYLDAVASALNSVCGYGNEALVAAATEQLRKLPHYDLSVSSHGPAEQLAARVAALLPDDLDKVFFVNSGSETAEVALRIVMDYWRNTGKPRGHVVTFARGYHGSTALAQYLSALAVTDTGFVPLFPINRVEWPSGRSDENAGDAAALLKRFEAVVDTNTAAVVVEPLLNVGGGVVLPEGFLSGLRELCDRTGALLVLDEVFTGFGRTGRMFGFEHEGVTPDVVMMSKGISSGFVPLGAVAARRRVHDSFAADPFFGGLRYGHTTSGHAVACAVGLRTLELIEEHDLVANADTMGALLRDLVKPLSTKAPVVDVRGLGLVVAVELESAELAQRLTSLARREGLLLRCQQNAVMAIPPLIIGRTEVEEISQRWSYAVDALTRSGSAA